MLDNWDGHANLQGQPVHQIHGFFLDAVPYIMGAIMSLQVWMLKQIIDFGRWRARQEEKCEQHSQRDKTMEQQLPIALEIMAGHGTEMETIRSTVLRLDQRMADGFSGIDKRLDKLDANHTALLQLIPKPEEG